MHGMAWTISCARDPCTEGCTAASRRRGTLVGRAGGQCRHMCFGCCVRAVLAGFAVLPALSRLSMQRTYATPARC